MSAYCRYAMISNRKALTLATKWLARLRRTGGRVHFANTLARNIHAWRSCFVIENYGVAAFSQYNPETRFVLLFNSILKRLVKNKIIIVPVKEHCTPAS